LYPHPDRIYTAAAALPGPDLRNSMQTASDITHLLHTENATLERQLDG
jgi:hypothetical protein